MSKKSQYLTRAEAAAVADKTTKTIDVWRTRGHLPAYLIGPGKQICFRRDDLEKLI